MNIGHTLPAPRQILRILCLIRLIPLGGLFVGIYYLLAQRSLQLHWEFIFALLVSLLLIIGLTWLRSFHPRTISSGELFGHLVFDIALYSLLMFNTGGAANPFITYLLVPVTIAAITLPATLTWLVGGICLGFYSALLIWYVPVPIISPGHSSHHSNGTNVHLLGMWLNFLVSAGLIAFFVNKMAETLREQQQLLTAQKEQRLEDDQLLAVATLAASAAHELGTPLNTMKLLIDDWHNQLPKDLREDANIFGDQIARCQTTLKKLSGVARSFTVAGEEPEPVRQFFQQLMDSWLVMRPDVSAQVAISGSPQDAVACFHPALTAALHNLLNNAADASPDHVSVDISWTEDNARLTIRDAGKGIDISQLRHPLNNSDKPTGMGLGLYLSRSILERHGGQLSLDNLSGNGTLVTVTLPLQLSGETP